MKVSIRADSVEIEGYVNAVERNSRPLTSRIGKFMERICKGAFSNALKRSDDVRLLLNHDRSRDLGGTKDGNLELKEDNIGLHARATITDREVIEKARHGDLVGWSFGFEDVPNGVEETMERGMPLRAVKDLNLKEVSILDRTRTPAYDGTLIMARSDDEFDFHGEVFTDDIEVTDLTDAVDINDVTREEPKQEHSPEADKKDIDYSEWESMIAEMKEGNR